MLECLKVLANKVFYSTEAMNDWVDHSFGYGGRTKFSDLSHDECLDLIARCREEYRRHLKGRKFMNMVPKGKR